VDAGNSISLLMQTQTISSQLSVCKKSRFKLIRMHKIIFGLGGKKMWAQYDCLDWKVDTRGRRKGATRHRCRISKCRQNAENVEFVLSHLTGVRCSTLRLGDCQHNIG
jgi:hypothetical protein